MKLNDNHLITPLLLSQIEIMCDWSGMEFNKNDMTIIMNDINGEEQKYFINYICRSNGKKVLKITNRRKNLSQNLSIMISVCMFLKFRFAVKKNLFNGILSYMPEQLRLDTEVKSNEFKPELK